MAEGERLATEAVAGGGRFGLQAAIAGLHDIAPTWEATDWPSIARLYDGLVRVWPSGAARLGRIVARGYSPDVGPVAALGELDADPELFEGVLAVQAFAARADLARLAGDARTASADYRRAAELATDDRVRRFLRRRTDRARRGRRSAADRLAVSALASVGSAGASCRRPSSSPSSPETASDRRSSPRRVKVLDAVTAGSDLSFEKTHFSLGAARYLATGDVLTDDDLAAIEGPRRDPARRGRRRARRPAARRREHRARAAAEAPLRARPLRQPAAHAAVPRHRRARSPHPGDVDFVVVREGTEGPYVGNGGAIRQGTPHEIANEVSVNTAYGVERVVRYAFEQAERAAQEAHPRAQDQRADVRRAASGSASSTRSPPSIRRSPSTTCTSTRPRSSWSRILLDST